MTPKIMFVLLAVWMISMNMIQGKGEGGAAGEGEGGGCYPLSRAWGDGPNGASRSDWWCGSDSLYGFLGFSYPVEDSDCDGYTYDGFVNDFKNMQDNWGATFVRLYLPTCYDTSFWVNMVKAAKDTNMALIPMVFWGFQQDDEKMKQAEQALLGVFNDSDVGSIAPFIIHSVAFGDELGEEGDYWMEDMKDFKEQLAQYNVPLTITDDWDRSVYKNDNGDGLSDFGKQVNDLCDLTHAHVQPYYHADQCPDAWHFWTYFTDQLNFLVKNNKKPIIISQTMWSYMKDSGHNRNGHNEADNIENYKAYWNTINSNCSVFKDLKISWFFHTYKGEQGFDLIGDDGKPVFDFSINHC